MRIQPNFVHYPLFRSEIPPSFLYPISALQFIREVYVLVLVLEEQSSQSQPTFFLARAEKVTERKLGERSATVTKRLIVFWGESSE